MQEILNAEKKSNTKSLGDAKAELNALIERYNELQKVSSASDWID
jgi:hypothetical protein